MSSIDENFMATHIDLLDTVALTEDVTELGLTSGEGVWSMIDVKADRNHG